MRPEWKFTKDADGRSAHPRKGSREIRVESADSARRKQNRISTKIVNFHFTKAFLKA